jgi:hypothetical protein
VGWPEVAVWWRGSGLAAALGILAWGSAQGEAHAAAGGGARTIAPALEARAAIAAAGAAGYKRARALGGGAGTAVLVAERAGSSRLLLVDRAPDGGLRTTQLSSDVGPGRMAARVTPFLGVTHLLDLQLRVVTAGAEHTRTGSTHLIVRAEGALVEVACEFDGEGASSVAGGSAHTSISVRRTSLWPLRFLVAYHEQARGVLAYRLASVLPDETRWVSYEIPAQGRCRRDDLPIAPRPSMLRGRGSPALGALGEH